MDWPGQQVVVFITLLYGLGFCGRLSWFLFCNQIPSGLCLQESQESWSLAGGSSGILQSSLLPTLVSYACFFHLHCLIVRENLRSRWSSACSHCYATNNLIQCVHVIWKFVSIEEYMLHVLFANPTWGFLQFRGIFESDLYYKWHNCSRNSVNDFSTRIAIVLHLPNPNSYLKT